jgi:hypothetical protein
MHTGGVSRVIGVVILMALLIWPASLAFADPNGVTLVNDTNDGVFSIRLSYPDDDDWGPDLLALGTLEKGNSTFVSMDLGGDCRFDVKVELIDEGFIITSVYQRGVDLCGTSTMQASAFRPGR